jgi:hypothetical protein
VAYPNVLVTEYLKKARRAQPDVMMKAMELINLSYQRLLTFEVPGGGFHWYGKPPANLILSAWGLLEFSDMAKVYDIDERIVDRTRAFIYSKQAADGSWIEPAASYNWREVQGALVQTAYIAWALLEAGDRGAQVMRAVQYVKDHVADARENPYMLGLVANVFALAKAPELDDVLATLDGLKRSDETTVFWKPEGSTLYYAQGNAAAVESTSLIAMAMARSNKYAATANKALAFLVKAKDGQGAWGSTQATILALKALIAGMSSAPQEKPVDVVVRVNGHEETITVDPDQADVMRLLDFTSVAKKGQNEVEVEPKGQGNFIYQFVGRHYLPWSLVKEEGQREPMNLKVEYDRTSLAKDDVLKATVTMRYNGAASTFMVIVDLGVPGGFTVLPEAFEKMQTEGKIDKFAVTGRQIILYFGKMEPGQVTTFSYEMRAKFPIKVKTPVSQMYEYYSPDRRTLSRPVELEVTD